MAASPQVVTLNPLYLNARNLVYTAQELRKPWGDVMGEGCLDIGSYRVAQRAAGLNMSVDVGVANTLHRAYVRGSVVADQGLYRCDYLSATALNLDIPASDPTNPRIDSIYLCVEDQQHIGSNNQATVRVVSGTATSGATLDNRTGAGAAPASMSSILVADILVAAAATSIANAAIRDRRPLQVNGVMPGISGAVDSCSFMLPHGQPTGLTRVASSTALDNQQAAALMYLPRRMVNAVKFWWKYLQGATAATSNYNIGIYDASGRQIVVSGATAFSGAANVVVRQSFTITSRTFEQGYYYVWIGVAAATASSIVQAYGLDQFGVPMGTMGSTALFATSGGTTAPTTILGLTDQNTVSGSAPGSRVGVPLLGLTNQ